MTHSNNKIPRVILFIGIIVLFFIVAAGYFAPQFSGKVLVQHDVQQYEGMCKDILENREATGEDAQWTGRMFGGMPAYLINVKYPAQLVKGSIGKLTNIMDMPASFLFFSTVAMWVAMLIFGINPWIGVIAALAYGLSTYFMLIIGAGHITKMWALVYAPLMVAGVYYTLRRNMWVGAALTALFTSLEIGANHPQITYYFAIAMAALWVSEAIYAWRERRKRNFLKRTALLITAGIMALGSNLSPLWYTMQHQKETTRGGSELVAEDAASGKQGLDLEYATAWSYGRAESLNMFVPDLMGGASTDTFATNGPVAKTLKTYRWEELAQYLPRYYGDQPYTAGPTYLGAATIFLALLGLFLLPARHKWWILAATIITLLMSWGNNLMWFTELLFNILPGYNKFRTLSMALVVVQWTIPLLAALTIAQVVGEKKESATLRKALAWATGISCTILVVMLIGGKSLGDFGMQQSGEMLEREFYTMLKQQGGEQYIRQGVHEQIAWDVASAMAEERAEVMRQDAWRSLLFVLLAAAAVWLYSRRKVITRLPVLCCVLAAIVAADLIDVDMRYLNYDSFVEQRKAQIYPSAADKFIMQDKDPAYRVLNLTVSPFNDATTSYFHRSVGGYHGAKLSRYQDVIDHYLNDRHEGVLDMLNVRYVITSPDVEGVIERPSANGAAWFVKYVHPTASAQEEIAMLGGIDSKQEATIGNIELNNYQLSDGEIYLTEYRPNYQRYDYSAEGDGFAVFSEIYTEKGWSAFIDGEQVKPLRADYILRALELPAGEHTVEWRYRAPNWTLVEGITLFFSLAILAAIILTLIYSIRNERRQKIKA